MKNNLTLKLPLQFFAEGGDTAGNANTDGASGQTSDAAGSDSGGANTGEPKQPDKPAEKTFTQEEVNKIVSDRLKAEQKKIEKKLADEAAEAAKVASMNAEEKAKHDAEKREKELADREAELTRREKTQLAREKLAAKGLSDALISAVALGDEDEMDKSVAAIEKAFSAAVSAEVAKKLAGPPPKAGTTTGKDPFEEGFGD